ncbi:MAG: IS200/IS605 family transposase [Chloroflexota bacterium]
MTASVLVVTPHTSFGEMIRASLEETNNYRVSVAADEPSAILQLKAEACSLAFLDMDLGAEAVAVIGRALRMAARDLQLVIVSDEDIPPALDSIRPWTLLRKPFYLPELMKMLGETKSPPVAVQPVPGKQAPAKVAANLPPAPVAPGGGQIAWLQDVNKAAQRLTRLTLESSAQAALITRTGKLWAYAGQLAQNAAQEIVQLVTTNWDDQSGGDLLRFARLESTKAEHMLYATLLDEVTVLALVFDAETPFSTIRSQANSLARSMEVEKTGPVETARPVKAEPPRVKPFEPSSIAEFEGENLEFPAISEILSDIPAPNPTPAESVPAAGMRMKAIERDRPVKQKMVDVSAAETRPSTPLSDLHPVSRESSPAIRLDDLVVAQQAPSLEQTVEHVAEELEVTAPSKSRPVTPVRPPAPGELDETRPHSITEVAGRVIVEPVSPALYNLTYACLLVPRFSSHYLTGDLADRLGEWLPHICIAFGWRLEFMAVRPEYIQWVVNVPPNTSPGYLMRIMRQQTSEKIFTDFPRLKKENPSGDFWAPGYLIMGGTQPHPPQLVKDYIKQTRQRQGVSRPRK